MPYRIPDSAGSVAYKRSLAEESDFLSEAPMESLENVY